MTAAQGDLTLLQDPVAQGLLNGQTVMRLAYTWSDGTPRVVPHWFHWNGREVVLGTPADAPKVSALQKNPHVALTIDTTEFPPRVLLIRGTATIDIVDGVVPEYAETACRYFGDEEGAAWVTQIGGLCPQMARVVITPTWVGILDFEIRLPSAVARAIERSQANAG